MDKPMEILSHFVTEPKIVVLRDGHINDTYLTLPHKYIIQRINTRVFTNFDKLMDNIFSVTEFLKKKIVKEGGDPERETLTFVKTKDGKNYYTTDDGEVYRAYIYVDDAFSINRVTEPKQLFYTGKAFGKFQNMLSDYPAETLFDVIPDFHNTRKRYNDLKQAIKEDRAGRADSIKEDIEFALSQESYIDIVTNALKDGTLPSRVTHNDTKINNVLFDRDTKEGVCVIDLDTVMSGSMLFDFGDALRIGASTADEDETDLSKVWFDLTCFKQFAKGYLSQCRDILTKSERDLLAFSAKLMTYECGIRFLTDYLNGDVYFKIHREGHNLDRARNQFKLVKDIENKMEEMKNIINNIK